jgi:phosphodiesterase/alkaline phosphatase D-like protein
MTVISQPGAKIMFSNANGLNLRSEQLSRWILKAAFALILSTQVQADEDNYVTHGPILGRVTAHEIGIWARTWRAAPFRVRYGLLPDQLDLLSEPVTTMVGHDNSGWLELSNLQADTRYYYELVLGEGETAIPVIQRPGSFRTLPDVEQLRDEKHNPEGKFNFSFELGACNNQVLKGWGPEFPAYGTMLERGIPDQISFALLNGDWIYEDGRDYAPEKWLQDVGLAPEQTPEIVSIAPTIVGVWENYKRYLERSSNLSRWHRNVPSYFTLDDHEILNDVFGAGTPGFRNRRAAFRDIGIQAWYDYIGWSNPAPAEQQGIVFGRAELQAGSDILFDKDAHFNDLDLDQISNLMIHWGEPTAGVNKRELDHVGGDPNAGPYLIVERIDDQRLRIHPEAKANSSPSYSIGRQTYSKMRVSNADFFFLDTRAQRDVYDLTKPDKPGVSLLGLAQKKWLKEQMHRSDAEMFFVASSVNLTIPHVGTSRGAAKTAAEPERDEAWTVYLQEREEMIRFWDSLGKPVFVLTADLHDSFAIKVTDRVWEIASAPHNSRNHALSSEGNRPANGLFEHGGRTVDIRWSNAMLEETPVELRLSPVYTIVQINNVFKNRRLSGPDLSVAFPRPQVIFQFYSGLTGRLLYAESIVVESP